MSEYEFVGVEQFTPNDGTWTPIGIVTGVERSGSTFQLTMAGGGPGPQLTVLSPTMVRIRFNPAGDYTSQLSYSVISRDFGFDPATLTVTETANAIEINTATIRVVVERAPYRLLVYKGSQLIHADAESYNLVSNGSQVANLKLYPPNALYVGFGEKAGATLAKNGCAMTFFNFDNFTYASGPDTPAGGGGPLDPTEPLYNSTPFLIETNPSPTDAVAGPAYCYGLFLDNPAQSYFNIGDPTFDNLSGKYFYGAQMGDLDVYLMVAADGNDVGNVVNQFTQLTGRPAMPPRYTFGYHQGAYGYYDRFKLEQVANAYRAARIPIDGLHIDVDFQDNYRTFTSSAMKFPNVKEMFDDLRTIGFKCSTNITALITANPYDENGQEQQIGKTGPGGDTYATRVSGLNLARKSGTPGAFITNSRSGQPPTTDLFVGNEGYGTDFGTNPYPYPPLTPNAQGQTALGSYGYHPDLGDPDVRAWWGQQYEYLLSIGLEMIWQDMTCPALAPGVDDSATWKTFPLDLVQTDGAGNLQPNAMLHNAYALLLCEATWNGLRALDPDRRHFIIARGGYAGIQRYAGLWTGDSASSWDFLKINIPEVLNFGLSGQPISGCDIGGFAPGADSEGSFYVSDGQAYGQITDYELYTRWMTLGALLPWYRNHYDGYAKGFQEPYLYGEPVPTNCRTWIEIRYRLLQVFYDAMYQSTQTGMPIARALFLEDADDPNVYDHLDDQFFLGADILVAPIVAPHDTASPATTPQRQIYLPAGLQWYAYQNGAGPLLGAVDGGTTITFYAPLTNPLYIVPIYVRAGAIVPTRQVEQWVGELDENPLTIEIYPGPDRSYQLYQDDGISTKAETAGAYRLTEVSHTGIQDGQQVRMQRLVDGYTPPEHAYVLALLGTNAPGEVSIGGDAVANVGSSSALSASSTNGYYHDDGLATTFVKVFDMAPDLTVEVLW